MNISELNAALKTVSPDTVIKVTLTNCKNALCTYKKTVIRKNENAFLAERFTEKQAFHENVEANSLTAFLQNELVENYNQLSAVCVGFDYDIKISKKGRILTNRRKNDSAIPEAVSHNRTKNYIFREGIFVPALYELGVMTSEGRITSSGYDKFKQINRFTECVDDAFKNEHTNGKHLEIIDFGCGKSYLTFVLYYYFTEIKKMDISITCLDLKREVIEKCNMVAEKYGYKNLKFLCGDIKDYKPAREPDMVISLHACDTATDYALYHAINWGSKYIFSVPCCQHELNSTARLQKLPLIGDYGLIKERFCALATDALRAKILEYCGYKTDILEFIDMDNSPKNMLIRARKKKSLNEYKRRVTETEINEFCNTVGTEPTLKKLIFG